jgi:hypothetical protein
MGFGYRALTVDGSLVNDEGIFDLTHAQQVESVAVFTPTITEESWSILLVPMIEII